MFFSQDGKWVDAGFDLDVVKNISSSACQESGDLN